jgi:hypothetical protein
MLACPFVELLERNFADRLIDMLEQIRGGGQQGTTGPG